MANRKNVQINKDDTQYQFSTLGGQPFVLNNDHSHVTGTANVGNSSTGFTTKQFGNLANYKNLSDFLAAAGRSGDISMSDLLSLLSISMGDMSGAQRADWNKQLLDQQLALLTEQEKRAYNESQLKEQRLYNEGALAEQRLYDNPLNQLARLMGSGISRDAAIQMLSGGSGSGGSGGSALIADPVTGDAAALAPGVAATQSDLNRMQEQTALANTIINGAGAVCGLVSLGFSIPQSIQQTQMLKMHNYLTAEQLASYKSAGTAFQILNAAGAAADSFGSVASAASAITQLANNGNVDAAAFVASGGIDKMRRNAPFASRTLGELYKSERSSADYDKQFQLFTENEEADKQLKNANRDYIQLQINNFQDTLDNLRADTQYKRDSAALARANARLAGEQVKTQRQITKSLTLENNLEEAFQTATDSTGRTGLQLYTDERIQDLVSSVGRLTQLNNDEAWKKEANMLLKNYDNMIAVYELGELYSRGEIDFINNADKDTKDLLYFCRAANSTGLFDYVRSMAEAETAGDFHAFGAGGSTSAPEAVNTLVNRGRPKSGWRRFVDWKPFN